MTKGWYSESNEVCIWIKVSVLCLYVSCMICIVGRVFSVRSVRGVFVVSELNGVWISQRHSTFACVGFSV